MLLCLMIVSILTTINYGETTSIEEFNVSFPDLSESTWKIITDVYLIGARGFIIALVLTIVECAKLHDSELTYSDNVNLRA